MTVDAAVWCIACGARPDVALTLDYGGTLAHYGACWDHVATVARRAQADLQHGGGGVAHRRGVPGAPLPVAPVEHGGGGADRGGGTPSDGGGGIIEGVARD
jgi:hypothetical protein